MLGDLATGLFVLAVYGSLAFPVALGVVAWRTAPETRARRSLAITAAWIGLCVVAGVGRLSSDDAYYSPKHVTDWAYATADERRAIVLFLLAAGAAAVVALAVSRREQIRPVVAVALISVSWLIDVLMLAYSVSLGLH